MYTYTPAEEAQLQALLKRRENNKNIKKVNNADLYAGSPMYYYCQSCDGEMSLPESHLCAAPTLCSYCKELVESGLLARTGTRSP
jgi:RNA polymerase-binding transcription factor DksA